MFIPHTMEWTPADVKKAVFFLILKHTHTVNIHSREETTVARGNTALKTVSLNAKYEVPCN